MGGLWGMTPFWALPETLGTGRGPRPRWPGGINLCVMGTQGEGCGANNQIGVLVVGGN